MKLTKRRAFLIGEYLGVNFDHITNDEWLHAIRVEKEHGPRDKKTNVTYGDLIITAKIALAHLKEFPDYYKRLERMEKQADKYWHGKSKPKMQLHPRITKTELYKIL